MRYSQWIGIAAAVILIIASFLPWAFFPDLNESFTGFFSERNRYGRPGTVLIFFSVVMIVLYLIPKVWAKRANILVAAISFAFCIRCFMLYTACYSGICPGKEAGIIIVLVASAITLAAALLPDLPVRQDNRRDLS
ncbi:MAG TPA: hypothetical protein VGR89_12705 [Puia sp.]|nr:hypothetical protein [Puia sp.]